MIVVTCLPHRGDQSDLGLYGALIGVLIVVAVGIIVALVGGVA